MPALECDEGNEHFLHADSSMLESVTIIGNVIVVVVGICKERVVLREDIRR